MSHEMLTWWNDCSKYQLLYKASLIHRNSELIGIDETVLVTESRLRPFFFFLFDNLVYGFFPKKLGWRSRKKKKKKDYQFFLFFNLQNNWVRGKKKKKDQVTRFYINYQYFFFIILFLFWQECTSEGEKKKKTKSNFFFFFENGQNSGRRNP